jgi:hypothetical protein
MTALEAEPGLLEYGFARDVVLVGHTCTELLGEGEGAFGLGPVGEEAAGLPAQRVAVVPAPLLGSALGNERVLSEPTSSSPPPPPEGAKADAHRSACARPTIHPRSGLGLKEPVPVPGVVVRGADPLPVGLEAPVWRRLEPTGAVNLC